jgi:DNA polymerase I
MCAHELRSGRELRIWGDQLLCLRAAPFDVGPASVLIAYNASAELSCFLELGWPLPHNVICLYAEHRVETNGRKLLTDNSILGALALRGLSHIDAGEKEAMRGLILSKERLSNFSSRERQETLDYCWTDIVALEALLARIPIDLPFALLRGRYQAAVARMMRTGVPIDVELFRRLSGAWDRLKLDLIASVDAAFGVYENGHRRYRLIEQWLDRIGLRNSWPRTPTGLPKLDGDTLKDQATLRPELPELQVFRELDATLNQMRFTDLAVGGDGRNRTMLGAYVTITGRNAPKAGEFIFGPATWIRGLIKPPEGFGICYFDYKSQEIVIVAAQSGDGRLAAHCATGDVYWNFAEAAGLADRGERDAVRDLVKVLFLAIGYGMGFKTLARWAGISEAEAKELIETHCRLYPDWARWREDIVDRALLNGWLRTPLGWRRFVSPDTPIPQLMNWPVQSRGADIMRAVCIAATEAGIELAAPVHDGFLTVSPLGRIEEDRDRILGIMKRAGEIVTGGLTIRVDDKTIIWPNRYMDKCGLAMWNKVMALLQENERSAA